MKIAIQGEPGSFSHEAALKLVPAAEIVPCALSAEVFAALSSGSVDAAVIPIENSLAGSVAEHFDLLLVHDVTVERETLLRIRHNLIAIAGAAINQIDRVFSHPVALAQCRRFLAAHPRMEAFAAYDTAGSVKQLVELRDRRAAAIASEAAARYYGANILAAGIEDNPENYTRFFLVRRSAQATPDPEASKISVAFSLEHRPACWSPRSARSPPWAPISPRSSRAPSTASPGSTSSTSIVRFVLPRKERALSMPCARTAAW
jgi:prephenate dehydratase